MSAILSVKLLKYALDASACEGEAENAAVKFIRTCRRDGVTAKGLAKGLAEALAGEFKVQPEPAPPRPRARAPEKPPACHMVMPFGKYKGWPLGQIGQSDPGYLAWVSEEVDKAWLREAASSVLDWLGGT